MEQAKKSTLTDTIAENFNDFEKQLNGASNLPIHQVRKKAIGFFKSLGIPDTKHEEYKFSNFKKPLEKFIDSSNFNTLKSAEANTEVFEIKNLQANVLVFFNGKYSNERSKIISPESEVLIKEFSKASEENRDLVEQHFSKYADAKQDAFVALNTAFSENGAFIHVGDNKVVSHPILLHFINDTTQGTTYNFPRNLLVVGKNSQVSVIEKFDSLGSNENFSNTVTEISLEENAFVDYTKVQNDQGKSFHVGCTQVFQARSSVFNAYTFTLAGEMVRNNLNIVLNGEGGEANMYGLYLLNNKTHVDNHTVVDHRAPNANSNELYKGVLDDKSKGVFNGKIFVRQNAQKTNAFQSNNNILLSDEAVVNTKPQLEIWADDVKCSHGCTTGQLDNEALFYLRARGLSKESAKAMLLYAFAKDIIENIKSEALKTYLDQLVSERLHQTP